MPEEKQEEVKDQVQEEPAATPEAKETPAAEENSVNEQINEIFSVICDMTGSEVKLEAPVDGGKAKPAFDINGAISKIVALSVYCGMNVPASFGPAYNRVHADVEYWKQRFKG